LPKRRSTSARTISATYGASTSQYILATLRGTLRIGDRVVERRPLRYPRQGGGFTERKVIELLAEVGLRGRGHAVGALAEEDHVEIQRENFLLGEFAFQPVGDEGFLQFAANRLLLREESAARRLHGDCAAALCLARRDVHEQAAQDAVPVETMVFEKSVVLGRDERLAHDQRDLLVLDRVAALLADLGDQVAGTRVHAQRHRQLVVFHRGNRRQRRFQVHVAADNRVNNGECDGCHTHGQLDEQSKVVWLHRIRVSSVARTLCPMHSNRRRYAYSPKGGDAKLPV
jgi:hypothetical protein